MKTYAIFDRAGVLMGSQTVLDQQAPNLTQGQFAIGQAVGFASTSGTFSGMTAGASLAVLNKTFNITLSGTFVGIARLERSFDAGVTWFAATFADGTVAAWSVPASTGWSEPESGVLYRLNCTAFTSGPIAWRLSQ